jgi:hypothetical protein
MPARSISFVIPVKDDGARLRVCVSRICERVPAGVDVEIVVADNGSTDDSPAVARELGATVLSLPGIRVGELRNRAAAATRGEILAFVDADNEIAQGWIAAAIDALSDPSVAAVGAPYHSPTPGTRVQQLYDRLRRHPTSREATSWLGSGNMAVRRSSFEAVGGFDTTLETCEDVDLCRKLRASGHTILADHQMRNVHHGDPRTLGQVFFGELWRGRDNIRVSLRPPWSGRTLVSAALPLANLVALVVAIVALAMGSRTGVTIAIAAAGYVLVAIALRASVMTRRASLADWPAACAVAAAYEAGRALSITGRFGYRRRRPAATSA